MNPCYDDDRPDPAADLLDAECDAWSRYHGLKEAPPELKRAWREIHHEIVERRRAAGWPRSAAQRCE